MHNMAKVPISPDHIFSTTVSGQPKSDILKDLQQQHPGASCHFVEDKLGTLEKVCHVNFCPAIYHGQYSMSLPTRP